MATGLGDVAIGNRIIANIIETDSITTSEVHYPNALSFINETTGYTTMEISDEDFALTGKTIYAWGNDLANPGTTTEMFSVGVNSLGNFEIYDLNNGQPRMTINASTGNFTFNPPLGGGSSTGGAGGLQLYLNNSSYPSNNTAPDNTATLLLTPANYTTPQTNLSYSFVGSSDNSAHLMGTFTTSFTTIPKNLIIPAGFWDLNAYTLVNQVASQVVFWFDAYYVNSGTEYLIASGITSKSDVTLALTSQVSIASLYIPTTNVIAQTDFLRIKVYVQQPTGNTNGHTFKIDFNDNTISHLHTSIISDQASTIDTTEISSAGTYYPTLVSTGAGNQDGQTLYTDTGISFNSSTNNLTTTTFTGALSGNATTATTATNVNLTNDNTAGVYNIPFAKVSTGSQQLYTDTTGLFYNPSTNNLSTSIFTGNLTGTASNATNAVNAINATTANTATYATSAGSAGSADSMLSVATNTGLYGQYYYMNMCAQPISSASYRFVNTSVYFDNSTTTMYCTNFDGLATTASKANQVIPQVTPTTTVKYLTFVENSGSNYDLLVDKTVPLTYTPSTGTISSSSFTVAGGANTQLRVYDRSATPTNYWDIYNTSTNLAMFLSYLGVLTVLGTSCGYYMRSRTDNANTWQTYATGSSGSSTYYWNSTNGGNQTYLQDTGMLHLDGTNAMLRLADQSAGGAFQIFMSSGALNFKNNALVNSSMTLNGYGWMNLIGTQARVQLNSQAGLDNWTWFVTGATGTSRMRYTYYNGSTATSINPFDVLNDGTMLLGTSTTALPDVQLFGNTGEGSFRGGNSAYGLVGISSGIIRLATNASSTTCCQLRISGLNTTLGVWDFQYGGTSQSVASVINQNNTADPAHMEIYHITAHGTAGYFYQCLYNTNTIGGLKQTGATTITTITSSDYRLKDDITPLDEEETGRKIDSLKPCSFTWKTDQKTDTGFIAHEFAETFPSSVFGEKDAVKADGSIDTQMISVSSTEIIATLVAELQFLRKRVATLEQKLNLG